MYRQYITVTFDSCHRSWYAFLNVIQEANGYIFKMWTVPSEGVNPAPTSAAYIRLWIGSALGQMMACRIFVTKPLSKPVLFYCQLDL